MFKTFLFKGAFLMRIGLICGGPSAERGFSLNSARSAMDHLTPLGWEVILYYCDLNKNFYRLSYKQLYSNTPYDFDFKLADMAQPLSPSEFIDECRNIDIVLPVIHGNYGEDGELQELLEKNDIPFVGSSSKSCRRMFDKLIASREMAKMGKKDFTTLPNCCIYESNSLDARLKKATEFFEQENVKKVVVKPSAGGSSIGVSIATTPQEVVKCTDDIFSNKYGGHALIEPYCKGKEFTVIVLQNQKNEPIALIPTEIDLMDGEIYTTRNKYLPSHQVKYFCPPRFDNEIIKKIQKSAENLFKFFEMSDFSRIDGRVLDDGCLMFSDFNPISSMEQDSDFFLQGSLIGLNHSNMLRYIITNAAQRYGNRINCDVNPIPQNPSAQKVRILFGGETSERQVSVMSGKNVWLKLLHNSNYQPLPYILAPRHDVWELPYSLMLHSTFEDILGHCADSKGIISKLKVLTPPLCERLGIPTFAEKAFKKPRLMDLDKFVKEAANENAFVFIALHGGEGEDGRLQAKLNDFGLAYNGSDVEASYLCMDKYKTGEILSNLKDPLLMSATKILISPGQAEDAEMIWNDAIRKLNTNDLLIKPQADGSSAGVMRLKSASDLKIYLQITEQIQTMRPTETVINQHLMNELSERRDNLILEPFIVTDEIMHAERIGKSIILAGVPGPDLVYKLKTGWIELTVGVLEDKGIYHALTPSITVVQGTVLSLEEKFQGGTGVNLTPPPEEIIKPEQIDLIKTKIEMVAKVLGIQGYARIDIFFNIKSDKIIVIEANTLPGLTPSTVIYHQALAENNPLNPQEFLSKLIKLGTERRKSSKSPINVKTNKWYVA
jgi:D-alanine--D-alanine ligase